MSSEPPLPFSARVGNTPLVRLHSLSLATGCEIYGKAEYCNPGGSVKDRPAVSMIDAAEADGCLVRGSTDKNLVVEATAGNTGVGLVHVANERGYRCIFCCPESTSREKTELLTSLGADVRLCPCVPGSDPNHFQATARRLAAELGGFYIDQSSGLRELRVHSLFAHRKFFNLHNGEAHYRTTGPEIWRQTDGKVTGVAMATGTGGSLSGISRYLKEVCPSVTVYYQDIPGTGVKAERLESEPELVWRAKTAPEKEGAGSSKMEGIGSSVLYANIPLARVDGCFITDDITAIRMCHYLKAQEGIFVGGSAGVNVVSAYLLAKKLGPGNTIECKTVRRFFNVSYNDASIVTLLCDGGERYASKLSNEEWLRENGFDIGDVFSLEFMRRAEEMNGLAK